MPSQAQIVHVEPTNAQLKAVHGKTIKELQHRLKICTWHARYWSTNPFGMIYKRYAGEAEAIRRELHRRQGKG